MENDKLLHFIRDRITEVNMALFYCYSNCPLKINNAVITTYAVDGFGSIMFFLSRPPQLASQFEQEFPAGLSYYKKGNPFYLKIFGTARIIIDPEELAYQPLLDVHQVNAALTTHLLIKLQISKAEYYDYNYEHKNVFLKKVSSTFSKLFDSPGVTSGSYDLSHKAELPNYSF